MPSLHCVLAGMEQRSFFSSDLTGNTSATPPPCHFHDHAKMFLFIGTDLNSLVPLISPYTITCTATASSSRGSHLQFLGPTSGALVAPAGLKPEPWEAEQSVSSI